MRSINLVPERYRPRRPSGGQQGSAYAVLAVLGVLLVAVAVREAIVYKVDSRRAEAARVTGETREAEARARALGAFGNFAQLTTTRLQSVRERADARLDWERLVRELAHVLPEDVVLTDLDASAVPAAAAGGAPPAGPAAPAASGPSLKLSGCAPEQPDVATVLVRLRRLHAAEEVKLTESGREGDSGAAGGSSGGAGDGCAKAGGRPSYKFQISVAFRDERASADRDDAKTPKSLGGGA